MHDTDTHVIVGAGLAGAKAAEALRAEGFDGRIVLIGDEAEQPYERPPLSKEYLRGESARDAAHVHPASFYQDNAIELRTGTRVERIDPAELALVTAGGERLLYDRLLLATGARPRPLRIPGAHLDGVHYLRELHDADALAERLRAGGHAVVIGGGWIGAEVAASARQAGLEVTILEMAALPLERVLGSAVAQVYADVHRDHGVDLLTRVQVERIDGAGRAERVVLADGRAIDCDFVVVGVGVVPNTELAEAAGIVTDNGVAVDERLATSAPGVYAAGDVANAAHPFYGRRLRVEHWANALHQPETAAAAMLGKPAEYERLPYFFSDQHDVGMEYTGFAASWDEVVFRGDPATRRFIAFWISDGRVVAGMNVNVWDVTDSIEALIRSRQPVDIAALRDVDTPLEDSVRARV